MEVKFARNESVASTILRLLEATSSSIDAALYRLNNPRLAEALEVAAQRGVRVRLLLDGSKYQESHVAQDLRGRAVFPVRLAFGRQGSGSKMHHKFVVLDRRTVLTGSYNWTLESEDENHENLIISDDQALVEAYSGEFEALWTAAAGDGLEGSY